MPRCKRSLRWSSRRSRSMTTRSPGNPCRSTTRSNATSGCPYQSFANTVANAQHLEIPDLALGMSEAVVKVFAVCEEWPSERAPAIETQPVWSEIPTLILSGAYDNLTPVSWNKSAFETLPNGVFVPGSRGRARRHHLLGLCRPDRPGLHHRPGRVPGHLLSGRSEPKWALPSNGPPSPIKRLR